jgi:deoxycytidylate deaminase
MNNNIIKAIYLATEASKESPHASRHGAVCLNKRGQVVSIGYNNKRTSWLQRLYAKKVGKPLSDMEHAEVDAIRKAKSPVTLVVVRTNKKGDLRNSKPCSICWELIHDSGIKEVFYSDEEGIHRIKINET